MRTISGIPFYVRLAFVLFILMALGYLAIAGKSVLTPLCFSGLFAILLLPVAIFLEQKLHLSRAGAAIISVLLFIGTLIGLLYVLGRQLTSLATEWPLLKSQLTLSFYRAEMWIVNTFHLDPQKELNFIQQASDNLVNSSGAVFGKTVLSVTSLVLFWVFILIYTFFILLYRGLLIRFITVAFSETYAPVIAEIIREVKHIIRSYIAGLFIEMLLVAMLAISLFALIGIKYVLLLGLFVGLFNLIPYVGIFSALVISAGVTFATGDPRKALFVAVTVFCIHLVDSNFLMPKIVGSHVKINPLMVILGVVTGEMIWGISGMFLAIPYLAIAKVIFDRVEGLQPWGILLGEEERLPGRVRPLRRWMKKKDPKP